MRLRSPAEYYIKYLVCHPDRYDTTFIMGRLIDEGLDAISERYITDLRAKMDMRRPATFHPEDRGHAPSFAFVVKERINRLFQPDVSMKMALEILESPRAKEFVESMVLVHTPLSAIASFITKRRKVYCTAEALELYTHYFWNIELLDSTQMRVLLDMRADVAAANVPEFKDRLTILRRAYYKDPRKVAADLPYSPTSAMLAQMRMGERPSRVEIAKRMQETRDVVWLRAIEAAQTDGKGDDQKFLNYINGGRILEELLQLVVKPEDQLRDQLSAITLRTETKKVPSIHSLSDGRHTTELISMNKDAEDDESEPEGAEPGRGGGGAG